MITVSFRLPEFHFALADPLCALFRTCLSRIRSLNSSIKTLDKSSVNPFKLNYNPTTSLSSLALMLSFSHSLILSFCRSRIQFVQSKSSIQFTLYSRHLQRY